MHVNSEFTVGKGANSCWSVSFRRCAASTFVPIGRLLALLLTARQSTGGMWTRGTACYADGPTADPLRPDGRVVTY